MVSCGVCQMNDVERGQKVCMDCCGGVLSMKKYEQMVELYLRRHETLANFSYRDQVLPCAPTRRRGDFVYLLQDRVVILEVDEDEHRNYNQVCEIVRVYELHEAAQGRALILVRFNPIESLLPKLGSLLHECFVQKLPDNLLDVKFLGYNAQYDVVAEGVRIAEERFHGIDSTNKTRNTVESEAERKCKEVLLAVVQSASRCVTDLDDPLTRKYETKSGSAMREFYAEYMWGDVSLDQLLLEYKIKRTTGINYIGVCYRPEHASIFQEKLGSTSGAISYAYRVMRASQFARKEYKDMKAVQFTSIIQSALGRGCKDRDLATTILPRLYRDICHRATV